MTIKFKTNTNRFFERLAHNVDVSTICKWADDERLTLQFADTYQGDDAARLLSAWLDTFNIEHTLIEDEFDAEASIADFKFEEHETN